MQDPFDFESRNIHDARPADISSIFSFSTNSTASNLIKPRLSGNAGRSLERILSEIARKAGFGPQAIYRKIHKLYLKDWKNDIEKTSRLRKLCLKLIDYTKSVMDMTQFEAIMCWGDILRDHHEIYVWLVCNQKIQMDNYTNDLHCVIESYRSTSIRHSDSRYEVINKVLNETSQLVDCHYLGLTFLRVSRGRLHMDGGYFQVQWEDTPVYSKMELEGWGIYFKVLMDLVWNPITSNISQWYFQLWSSQIDSRKIHVSLAFHACQFLQTILKKTVASLTEQGSTTIENLCRKIHEHLIIVFNLGSLYTKGYDLQLSNGSYIRSSEAATHLNNLAELYNMRLLRSSGWFKETIVLKLKCQEKEQILMENVDIEVELSQYCRELLRQAQLELEDRDSLNIISLCTRFVDQEGKYSIFLELGDILQSHPEVYKFFFILGAKETMAYVRKIDHTLDSLCVGDTFGLNLEIFKKMKALLSCHSTGLALSKLRGDRLSKSLRDLKVIYLLNALQCNVISLKEDGLHLSALFYLKSWISQLTDAPFNPQILLHSYIALQSILKSDAPILEEHQGAVEELFSKVVNLLYRHLPNTSGLHYITKPDIVSAAINSTYEEILKSRDRSKMEGMEAYMLQLINTLFGHAKSKSENLRMIAIKELSRLFRHKNVFGWFLSTSPEAEECFALLIQDINVMLGQVSMLNDPLGDRPMLAEAHRQLTKLAIHKCGVDLLAPKHEKLHFSGSGLTDYSPLGLGKLHCSLNPMQEASWSEAFRILTDGLNDADIAPISLFYLSNYRLSSETIPSIDNLIARKCCTSLMTLLNEIGSPTSTTNKKDLSQAVLHIHTILVNQAIVIQSSLKATVDDKTSIYTGTSSDTSTTVYCLKDLEELSKKRLAPYGLTPQFLSFLDL